METSFISSPQNNNNSKKTIVVALIAVVALVGCVAVVSVSTPYLSSKNVATRGTYEEWKKAHNKTYGAAEDGIRFTIWQQTVKKVDLHNNASKSYKLAVNQFADLTKQEFSAIYLGAKKPLNGGEDCQVPSLLAAEIADVAIPESVDWRTQGRVGAVKDQKQCGSCWAFSTVGSLEGLYSRDNHDGKTFSEQQLVDCTGSYGNAGCSGGWVQGALHYVIEHGITTEQEYGYTAVDGNCKSGVSVAFKPTGCQDVPLNVDGLKNALQQGPVSIYVEADQDAFQLYSSGVVDDANCFAEGQIDHAVVAVGYTGNSWIVRNSWGPNWGDHGYIQISTETSSNPQGVCGVLSVAPTYPTL